MKHLVCLDEGDIAITFSKIGKTVIIQSGQAYVVDTAEYRNQLPGPESTKDVIGEKEKEGNN